MESRDWSSDVCSSDLSLYPLLYIQMLADAGGGAEAAEHEAQQHKAADDVVPDAFQRDKRAAEHLRKVGRILGIPAAECIVRAADAVSYTHLDVYKRQGGARHPPPAGAAPGAGAFAAG